LLVVDSETVTVCVWVREETGLENWVSRGLDVGDEVRGREGRLLDLGEVVLGVLVEDEFADGSERELLVRPDFGEIENVVAEFLGLLRGHGLDVDSPRGEVARLDGVEESLSGIVGVLTSQLGSRLVVESLESTISADVDLGVDEGAVVLEPLEGVARVAVLLVVAIGSSTVGEEDHDLVNGFRVLR